MENSMEFPQNNELPKDQIRPPWEISSVFQQTALFSGWEGGEGKSFMVLSGLWCSSSVFLFGEQLIPQWAPAQLAQSVLLELNKLQAHLLELDSYLVEALKLTCLWTWHILAIANLSTSLAN